MPGYEISKVKKKQRNTWKKYCLFLQTEEKNAYSPNRKIFYKSFLEKQDIGPDDNLNKTKINDKPNKCILPRF